MAKKFKLGSLTEDDFDQDYAPGRSEKTMSAGAKARELEIVARTRAAAAAINKRDDGGDQIVIVLERE